jgi:hypothetical protein
VEPVDDSVESVDPHECSSGEVITFVRSLGPVECCQSTGDQVMDLMELGVDDSLFFSLSLNEFQGVCGHPLTDDHMCECKHNTTDT